MCLCVSKSDSAAATQADNIEHRRVPRRVIHCNDGVIEEFSTDEDDNDELDAANTKPPVDPVITFGQLLKTHLFYA